MSIQLLAEPLWEFQISKQNIFLGFSLPYITDSILPNIPFHLLFDSASFMDFRAPNDTLGHSLFQNIQQIVHKYVLSVSRLFTPKQMLTPCRTLTYKLWVLRRRRWRRSPLLWTRAWEDTSRWWAQSTGWSPATRKHTWLKRYYSPEVRRGKYWGLGVFLLQYFPLVKIWKLLHYNCITWI